MRLDTLLFLVEEENYGLGIVEKAEEKEIYVFCIGSNSLGMQEMWKKLTPDDIYKLREKNIIISNCLWHYEENGLSWEQALFQAIIRLDKALHEAVTDTPNTVDQLNSTTNIKDFQDD